MEIYASRAPPALAALAAGINRAVGSPSVNRKRVGLGGLEIARACECVAFGCTRKVCNEIHPPDYEMTQKGFHASQDLMKVGWTSESATHVTSYSFYAHHVWLQ